MLSQVIPCHPVHAFHTPYINNVKHHGVFLDREFFATFLGADHPIWWCFRVSRMGWGSSPKINIFPSSREAADSADVIMRPCASPQQKLHGFDDFPSSKARCFSFGSPKLHSLGKAKVVFFMDRNIISHDGSSLMGKMLAKLGFC